jgi:hypothetical protein
MAGGWADEYRGLLAEVTGRAAAGRGFPVRAVGAAEARLGVSLPGALRDYYLSVGRHPINRAHNRLWPPDELEVSGGRVVFMEENQCVVFWGVPARGKAADPVVYQTGDLEDGDWYAEVRCSRFLAVTLCWQAVGGGLPAGGIAESVTRAARRALRGWRPVGRAGGLSAFARAGRVACVGGDGQLYVGARSRRDLRALEAELGVEIEET